MVACGNGLFSLLRASNGDPGAAWASENTMRATKKSVGTTRSKRRIVYFSIPRRSSLRARPIRECIPRHSSPRPVMRRGRRDRRPLRSCAWERLRLLRDVDVSDPEDADLEVERRVGHALEPRLPEVLRRA